MIDLIFGVIMGVIGRIGAFIIVTGIIGFLLILPLAINGGWIIYVLLGIVVIPAIFDAATDDKNKDNENKEDK